MSMSESGLRRYSGNPILTRADIPTVGPDLEDVSSVFNPGAVQLGGETILMLRVQNRGRETHFLIARSHDGVRFDVAPQRVVIHGLERIEQIVHHVYDARLTMVDARLYAMVALDLDAGCRLGVMRAVNLHEWEFLGLASDDHNRNGVLFPEKINGRYLRLDRPNRMRLEGGPVTGGAIWLSESEDLIHWRPVRALLEGRFHFWDELIGAGPPPIKTTHGWLCLYHGVATHFASSNIYQAGVCVVDLDDPSRVIGRSRYNILEPRAQYELTGQVPNVVFPSGAVVPTARDGIAGIDDEVYVYYGAADTAVGLATAMVGALLRAAGIAV
jgi:beta-1,4-mannooligosaccharide/beta-1,4-mannosyl-N-acetylglucosamine phosphorylase